MSKKGILVVLAVVLGAIAGSVAAKPAAGQTEECNHHDCFWVSGNCRTHFGRNCGAAEPWGCDSQSCTG